ncbi:MAG: HlyC/CorC family transporter [Clostridia bacterium]|nr:HlyC/CorC family transporter [Clostridia bacterium]
MGGPLLFQLVLILLNGFFAATECAVISLNDVKVRHDADEGDAGAARLAKLLDNPNKFLSTIQVCITLAGFMGSAFAADTFAEPLAAWLVSLGVTVAPRVLHTGCVVVITLILSFFTLVLGELVPKRLALQNPEKVARFCSGVVSVLSGVFKPVVWLLSASTNGILTLLGVNPHEQSEEVTEEEIRAMVDMGGETGAIEETEKEMIENIFEFNNRSAEDVMTHRTDVTSIWVGDDHDTIIRTILETGLSRFPVYDEDIDDIVGILSIRDWLLELRRDRPRSVRELMRPAYFVPETVQADVLFRDMQKRKVHMSIVVDEYGGMSGIVTMEDLLEEIVGNIYDEFDPQAVAEITKLEENLWRVAGAAALEDVAEALDVELPLDEDYDTLGGLIFDQFTTIPQDGSQPEVDVAGLHIKVELLQDHRVELALVSKAEPEATGETEEEE